MFRKLFLPLLTAGMLLMALIHVVGASHTLPTPPPPVEPPRTPFERTVSGVGTVEAWTENIGVGSALSGLVLEVYVPAERVGQRVKAGAPLFRVDDRQLQARLRACQAELAVAEAELAKREAQPRAEELTVSATRVRTAQANAALFEDQYQRGKELHIRHALSTEEFRHRQLTYAEARERLAQARAEHALIEAGAWNPEKSIARAKVARAKAEQEQVQTDLERTIVRAPVDGDVLQVNVRPGESINASSTRPLVVLGDTRLLHVRVEIDEQDIPRFQPGASARAVLRSNSSNEFALTFLRVEPFVVPKRSLTGDGTERIDTRVLQILYVLHPIGQKVYIGQQLDVFIAAEPEGSFPAGSKRPPYNGGQGQPLGSHPSASTRKSSGSVSMARNLR